MSTKKAKQKKSAIADVRGVVRCCEPLSPCPFCGERIDIRIHDSEGNLRDKNYMSDPWSGLSFTPKHEYTKNNNCPIATHEEEILGCRLYETIEELSRVWNKRTGSQ